MKLKYFYYFGLLIIAVLIYACQKDNNKSVVGNKKQVFGADQAQKYLDSSLKAGSNIIKLQSLDTNTNTSLLYWKYAHELQAQDFDVVETPIIQTQKEVPLYDFPSDSVLVKPDQSVAKATFSRAIIFQNRSSKVINKRVITYMPDKSYLLAHNNDASDNWLNDLHSFSGYIEYKTWDGQVLYVLRIVSGKRKAKYTVAFSKIPKNQINSFIKPKPVKADDWTCNLVETDWYSVGCSTTHGYESTTTVCDEPILVDVTYTTVCINDGTDPNAPQPPNSVTTAPPSSTGGSGGGGVPDYSTPIKDDFTNNIDTTYSKPCVNAVLKALEGLSKNMAADIIARFTGFLPTYHWTVLSSPSSLNYGNAITAFTNKDSLGNVYVSSRIYTGNFSAAGKLAMARTILHEAVHAYLAGYFRDDPSSFQLTYPQMWKKFMKYNDPNVPFDNNEVENEAHHTQMAQTFINDIATQLKRYGDSLGLHQDIGYYTELAWGGLTETAEFSALSNQADILKALSREQYGMDENGNPIGPVSPVCNCTP